MCVCLYVSAYSRFVVDSFIFTALLIHSKLVNIGCVRDLGENFVRCL